MSVIRFCFCILATAFCFASGVAGAEAAEIAVQDVKVGFNNVYTVGCATPIFVAFDAAPPSGAMLEVECPDPDGNLTKIRSTTRWNSDGMYGEFRVGRLDSTIRIRLIDEDGQILVEKTLRTADSRDPDDLPPAVNLVAHLVLAVGPARGFEQLDFENLAREASSLFSDGNHAVRFVSVDSTDDLPLGASGLDAADIIVLASEFDLPADRVEQLGGWIRAGGHLVVATGRNVEAFADSSVAELLSDVLTVDPKPNSTFELTGLESYSGRSSRIGSRNRRVPSANVTSHLGEVLIQGREGPLAVQTMFGFGKVSFLALELNEAPLSEWDALPAACHRIIFGKRYKQAEQTQENRVGQLSQSGVTDISTQLISTHGEFEGVTRASSWIVMGMLLLYVILIGPLDYLIVHKFLKRPHLTWFTFPLLVIGGAAVAIGVANQRNGSELKLNQLEIIDLNPVSEDVVRSQSLFTIYSPTTRRLEANVNAQWDSADVATTTSWAGIAEDVFGGMYRSGGVSLTMSPYSFSGESRSIENLPIKTWSTQRLSSDWQATGAAEIDSQLTSSSIGMLSGSFSHSLPMTIDRWILAYKNRVYRPAERKTDPKSTQLPPGRRWVPGSSRDLRSYLTGLRVRAVASSSSAAGPEIVNEQTEYDRLSMDPEYVIRMLTFHQIAGGTQYTKLRNDMLRKQDLSSIVKLDYAVLVGSVDKPTATLSIDGKPTVPTNYSGFVRLVIPVKLTFTEDQGFLDIEKLEKELKDKELLEQLNKDADKTDGDKVDGEKPDSDKADAAVANTDGTKTAEPTSDVADAAAAETNDNSTEDAASVEADAQLKEQP